MPIYELFRGKAVTGYGKLGKIPRALPARAEAADQEETALGPVTADEGILVWVGGHLLPRRMAKVLLHFFVCYRAKGLSRLCRPWRTWTQHSEPMPPAFPGGIHPVEHAVGTSQNSVEYEFLSDSQGHSREFLVVF